MAGSTAGWWPSDRDRFPPRFLLPPSLQTHNCIISTHLVSATVPLDIPRPLFLSLSLPFPPTLPPSPPSCLFLSLSFSLSSLSADPPLTSFSIRPDARLRTCASLVSSRSSDRPAGRPFLSLYHHISPSPLVFRTKELPHARNGSPPSSFFVSSPLLSITPMRCSSLAYTILPLALNNVHLLLSFSLSHLVKQRSCRVFASSFFLLPFLFLLAVPPPSFRSLHFLYIS